MDSSVRSTSEMGVPGTLDFIYPLLSELAWVSESPLTNDVQTSILLPMSEEQTRYAPGRVRDAILQILTLTSQTLTVKEIEERVCKVMGPTPTSSIRSYLRLNTPALFVREDRGVYRVRPAYVGGIQREMKGVRRWKEPATIGSATIFHADCFDWIEGQDDNTIHAVVTDPPYGLHEYSREQQLKLRSGKGGVWRIPPSYDGHTRSPLPRFTTLTEVQREELRSFIFVWARLLIPKLVPGANVIVASNPLLSFIVSGALADAGLERRGEIIRLVMTMRGGDRPKAAHEEFPDVSVMPRSMWEPWVVFRKPIEGRVQDNLRKWKTGGFRRPCAGKPFGDVIYSAPTGSNERELAQHPSLKPQGFLRQLVQGVLPLGEGVVLDPFAGAGSTLAAAEAVGYRSIGIEKDDHYFELAQEAVPRLVSF
jgi:DNA modification methylase